VGEPPFCTVEELGRVREAELVCAVGALGGRSLTFLGYTDPRIGPGEELFAYTENLAMLAGQAAASILQFDIGAVFTHGSNGEYGHPAHVLSYQAAKIAVEALAAESKPSPLLYTIAANFPDHPRPRLANKDDPAHLVLDISPALPQKEAAALCHRTQHALFVRRASQEAGRPLTVPEVIMRVESLRRVYPDPGESPEDEISQLLRPWEMEF
jgi:LmbE family N-acetylglucosaminyl deacetylase